MGKYFEIEGCKGCKFFYTKLTNDHNIKDYCELEKQYIKGKYEVCPYKYKKAYVYKEGDRYMAVEVNK